jgi:hypothetical protein
MIFRFSIGRPVQEEDLQIIITGATCISIRYKCQLRSAALILFDWDYLREGLFYGGLLMAGSVTS